MYCRRCGTQNQDGTAFCRSCGEPLNAAAPAGGRPAAPQFGNRPTAPQFGNGPAAPQYGSRPVAAQPKKNNNLILIGVAAAAVAVVVFLLFKLFFGGGGGPESIAEKAVDCIIDADAAGLVDLLPDELVEALMEEEDMTRKEMISELQDTLDDQIKQMDRRYDNWKITYEIDEVEDLSRREIRTLTDAYDDYYNVDIDVTEGKRITFELTRIADGDTDRYTKDLVVIKVDGSWYLDMYYSDMF